VCWSTIQTIQQIEQKPITSNHWTQTKPMAYVNGNRGPDLVQTQTCDSVKPTKNISSLISCSIYTLLF